MSDTINVPLVANDWTTVAVSGEGRFTLPVGGQFCIATSKPVDTFVGHRSKKRKLLEFSLSEGEILYVKSRKSGSCVVTMSQVSQVETLRWYPVYPGTPAYASIISAQVQAGSTVSLKFTSDIGTKLYTPIFDSESSTNRIVARSGATSGKWDFSGLTNVEIDGIPTVTGDLIPVDNLEHTFTATITITGNIKYFGANFAESTCWEGRIYDIGITGITNVDTYPEGFEFWYADNYAPDDGYTTTGVNGAVATYSNFAPEDFTQATAGA